MMRATSLRTLGAKTGFTETGPGALRTTLWRAWATMLRSPSLRSRGMTEFAKARMTALRSALLSRGLFFSFFNGLFPTLGPSFFQPLNAFGALGGFFG